MFFWLTLPACLDATALLPEAVAAGVAYVPGAAFYSAQARADTLRLSFVTVDAVRIDEGVRLLGGVLERALERQGAGARAG
jgi:2-aminoadipate transaminase